MHSSKEISRKKALLLYVLGFAIIAAAYCYPFIREGRFIIYGADAYTQQYPGFFFSKEIWASFFEGLKEGKLTFPLYDFSLGLGEDIWTALSTTNQFEPLYMLMMLLPEGWIPLAWSGLIVIRFFLGGLFFFLYAAKMGRKPVPSLIGALLYSSCGYWGVSSMHGFMAYALTCLPLILYGCEKVLRRESPFLLSAAVFLLALNGYYFVIQCSFVLAFYVLIRSFDLSKQGGGNYFRELFPNILRSVGSYLCGLLPTMPVLLPGIIAYLSSSRAGHLQLPSLVYSLSYIRKWFVQLPLPRVDWGMAAIVVICLAAAFVKPQKSSFRAWLVIGVIFVISPFADNALIGFGSSPYMRFWFALCFLMAWAVLEVWDDLGRLNTAQLLAASAAVALYLVLAGVTRTPAVTCFLLASYGIVLAASLAPKIRGLHISAEKALPRVRRVSSALLALVMVVNLVWYGYNTMNKGVDNYRSARFAKVMPAVTEDTLYEGVYRVDVSDVGLHRWFAPSNTPIAGHYMGLSEYFSVINSHYVKAMLEDWSLAPEQQGDHSFQGFNSCMVLNTLASVKYSFVRDGEEYYVPYGYNYVGDTEQSDRFTFVPDNGSTLKRYENLYALPLGYTYSSYISEEEYDSLNALEKQAALMQGVVVSEMPEGISEADVDLSSVYQLDSEWTPAGEETDTENGWAVEKGGTASWKTTFEVTEEAEIHVCLKGFQYDDGENGNVSCGLVGREYSDLYMFNINSEQAWVNLGTLEPGTYSAEFVIEGPLEYSMDGLEVWAYNTAAYAECAEKLQQNVLQNVVLDTNSAAGLLNTPEDTFLVLSIPYSTGWRATIDGVKVEPELVNSMYTGFEVPAGEHVIGLYYVTPGLKISLVLCAAGIALFLLQAVLWFVMKKRLKEN